MPNAHLLVEDATFSVQNQDIFETMLGAYNAELSEVLSAYDADVAAIQADRTLSQVGQLEKIQARAARAADFVGELDGKASQIDTETAKHVAAMTAALDANTWTSGNATGDALRAAELRAVLRDTDPLERQNLYRAAVAEGDLELVAVIETAPKLLRLLPADLGRYTMIENAGHYPHAQDPQQVAAALLPFLAGHTHA